MHIDTKKPVGERPAPLPITLEHPHVG